MNILFLGDSITDCGHCFSDDGLGYGYVKLIHERLHAQKHSEPNRIVNGGTDGFTFPRVYKKYRQFYMSDPFDTVVMTGGINDTSALEETGLSEREKDRFLEYSMYALTELISLLKENGVRKIILVEPFLFPRPAWRIKWMRSLELVRTQMQKISDAHETVTLLQVQSAFDSVIREKGIGEITTDGIHLTKTGQEILADRIYQFL